MGGHRVNGPAPAQEVEAPMLDSRYRAPFGDAILVPAPGRA
jgi:hypothetical protein